MFSFEHPDSSDYDIPFAATSLRRDNAPRPGSIDSTDDYDKTITRLDNPIPYRPYTIAYVQQRFATQVGVQFASKQNLSLRVHTNIYRPKPIDKDGWKIKVGRGYRFKKAVVSKMSFLFGRQRTRGPADLVREVRQNLGKLNGPNGVQKNVQDELQRLLNTIKMSLQGSTEVDPDPTLVTQMAHEIYQTDFLPSLANNLANLDFESRKDTATIFNTLLRHTVGGQQPAISYLSQVRPDTLKTLVTGYRDSSIAVTCGSILREAFKSEILARLVLTDPIFWQFFSYVQGGKFDVSSDAFQTFRDLLMRHKNMVADFLAHNYDDFFAQYNLLLQSDNYITKRQSIKLLGEILLDRANYNIMTLYVDSPDNLKLTMILLRDKSKNIQYEAFHVFKVFVANPKKSLPVESMLLRNKEQLLRFLPPFHDDRKEDDQFNDEKAFLIKQIESLQPTAATSE